MVNQSRRSATLLLFLAGLASAAPSGGHAAAELVGWTGRKARATQYHTQDASNGAYQYGYTGPHHAKSESSFNGVTRGGYSYIDANGLMQSVSYTADAANGFRVHASNLPQQASLSGVEEAARRRQLEQLRRAEAWPRQESYHEPGRASKGRSPFLLSAEEARALPAPRPSAAALDGRRQYVLAGAPAALLASPLVHSSMSHSQDSLGQYEYSYTGDTSAKTESRSLDGTTRGAYSYIDANGLLQQVHYIADRDGFRVLATNLPEA